MTRANAPRRPVPASVQSSRRRFHHGGRLRTFKSRGSRTRNWKDLTCPHRPLFQEAHARHLQTVSAAKLCLGCDLEVPGQHGLKNDGTRLQHQGLGRTQAGILDQAGLDPDQPGVRFVAEDFLRRVMLSAGVSSPGPRSWTRHPSG